MADIYARFYRTGTSDKALLNGLNEAKEKGMITMKITGIVMALALAVMAADYTIVKPLLLKGYTVSQSDDNIPEESTEPHSPEEDASDVRGC